MGLQVAILGSLEPRVDGEVVGVPAGKQRALLTLLALRAPQPLDGLLLMRITRPVPKGS